MIRTIISLDEEDKTWLDERARQEQVPMTQLVRQAIRLLRQQSEKPSVPFESLLERTSGLWQQGDGLRYQENLRQEWDQGL